jgi:predicted TIM-barrel fold metal-dependent hydrolase
MIIDAHMHVWEKVHGTIANEIPVSPLSNGMIRLGDKEFLGMPAYMIDCAARAEFAVAEFDAAGIDVGVVVQDFLDGEQNDYLRAIVAQFPNRFLIHALPNYWRLDNVVQEAERLLSTDEFCGMKLPAEHLLNKILLDDCLLMPIWEKLEACQKVLAVDLSEGENQVAEMESILSRCPKLRVAIGHFGMVNRRGWPGQLKLARFENVYLETGGIIWLYRHEGFPFPGAIEAIRRAMEEVGVEKLMWGSDWPRTMVDFTYRQSLEFIRHSADLNDHDKALVLGENARRLYQLEEPPAPRSAVPLITET